MAKNVFQNVVCKMSTISSKLVKLERVKTTSTVMWLYLKMALALKIFSSYSEYQWAPHGDQSTCGDGQLLMLYILFERVHLEFKNMTHST